MKNVTKFSADGQRELNKKHEIVFTVLLILGSIGLFLYIALGVAIEEELPWLEYLLYISSVFFGFGLVFLFYIRKTNKTASVNEFENTYEFFEEYFTLESTKKEETVASLKVYYADVLKISETKRFLFIYPNAATAYPVEKKSFSEEEYALLKGYLTEGIKQYKAKLKKK